MNEKPFSTDAAAPLSSQPVPAPPIASPVATPGVPAPAVSELTKVSLAKTETDATSVPSAPATEGPTEDAAMATRLESAIQSRNSGASWFYWIAGLSIINSLIVHFGGDSSFPLGLGATLGIDLFAREGAEALGAGAGRVLNSIAIALDFVIIGFFILCGKKAIQGAAWAFVVGGFFYTLDTLIMLAVQEWLGVGLHLWAMFSLFMGYKANQAVRELQRTAATSPSSA